MSDAGQVFLSIASSEQRCRQDAIYHKNERFFLLALSSNYSSSGEFT